MNMNTTHLKEQVQHGDIMFPVAVYKIEDNGKEIIQYFHWHDEVEFLLVVQGKVLFQVESNYFEVCEGQAVFVNSSQIHGGYSINGRFCSFFAIVFSLEFLCGKSIDRLQTEFVDPLIKKQYSLPVHIRGIDEWEKEVVNSLFVIKNLYAHKPFTYELSIKASIFSIMAALISQGDRQKPFKQYPVKDEQAEKLKTVLTYIHDNYNTKISIKCLAKETNMSVGHFYRFFKQMSNKTPVQYINFYRINKALTTLRDSNNKISAIAVETGYENISYFNNMFKKIIGCTPKEYRRQLLK